MLGICDIVRDLLELSEIDRDGKPGIAWKWASIWAKKLFLSHHNKSTPGWHGALGPVLCFQTMERILGSIYPQRSRRYCPLPSTHGFRHSSRLIESIVSTITLFWLSTFWSRGFSCPNINGPILVGFFAGEKYVQIPSASFPIHGPHHYAPFTEDVVLLFYVVFSASVAYENWSRKLYFFLSC